MRKWIVEAASIVFMLCSLTATTVYVLGARASRRAQERQMSADAPDWRDYLVGGHTIGADQAPRQLVVFADYQCPACRELNDQLEEVRRRGVTNFRIVYHQLPLQSIHPFAMSAAIAAECAATQGHFAEMHRSLYDNQADFINAPWHRLAAQSDVPDLKRFDTCMHDSTQVEAIKADLYAARRLRLKGTPSMLIDGKAYYGARPADTLATWLSGAERH